MALKESNIPVKDFVEKINNGEAKLLTLAAAQSLIGKRISWMYFGYEGNSNVVYTDVVAALQKSNDEVRIMNDANEYTFMQCYLDEGRVINPEPTFVCSDLDRVVYFLVEE